MKEERILKVSFNRSGGTASKNGMTTRITLPIKWVKDLGVTEEDREVKVKIHNDKIIIEKL
ncbi:AbrB/MazE/SpoVT family DNA-binding domain-containing protein [Clostridium perfringens]|uniref:AbrB/MazE/SpoVT family DNA-binding domain-containing protein n=1 Tax=Clostridium perfringens TaxID=1502 RepID=UPI0024BD50A8|nr:AbrB/MazE/SpoVT family DNA-binding domain-containing protein [Clostridium perfringens]